MRVLVATDGSENARAAVAWLPSFPLPPSSTMMTLAVDEVTHQAPEALLVAGLESALLDAARRTAEDAREQLSLVFPDTEARVVRGDAREAIVRVAEEWRADLIVVGARGFGSLKGWLLGSVSMAVVHWAPCPVLVVKGHPTSSAERIVIGVDGSADAMAATRFVAALPLGPRTTVTLVGVAHPPFVPLTAASAPLPTIHALLAEAMQARQRVIIDGLEDAAAAFQGRVAVTESVLKTGHAVEGLVEAAEEPGVELVVVGARGLGALERLLLGSVSDGVLRRVDRPVLVVKPRARARDADAG